LVSYYSFGWNFCRSLDCFLVTLQMRLDLARLKLDSKYHSSLLVTLQYGLSDSGFREIYAFFDVTPSSYEINVR
jgi:hypothetical protein